MFTCRPFSQAPKNSLVVTKPTHHHRVGERDCCLYTQALLETLVGFALLPLFTAVAAVNVPLRTVNTIPRPTLAPDTRLANNHCKALLARRFMITTGLVRGSWGAGLQTIAHDETLHCLPKLQSTTLGHQCTKRILQLLPHC